MKVLLLVKPARRPRWWPTTEKGRTAWATVSWDGEYVVGYSIGRHESAAIDRSEARAARRAWRQDNPQRRWDIMTDAVE